MTESPILSLRLLHHRGYWMFVARFADGHAEQFTDWSRTIAGEGL